jgi:hypothetical protein
MLCTHQKLTLKETNVSTRLKSTRISWNNIQNYEKSDSTTTQPWLGLLKNAYHALLKIIFSAISTKITQKVSHWDAKSVQWKVILNWYSKKIQNTERKRGERRTQNFIWLTGERGWKNQLSCYSNPDFCVLKSFYQTTSILRWLKPTVPYIIKARCKFVVIKKKIE